jgi:hypothetical protein
MLGVRIKTTFAGRNNGDIGLASKLSISSRVIAMAM